MANAFDELQVGQRWTSPGRTLTEADLLQACMTSGDWHPIHADEDYASRTPLGRRIFHGTWGLHVAVGMATPFPEFGEDVIGALGLSEWRYLKPLFVGDTVRVEVEIAAKRRTSDGRRGVIERRLTLRNQAGEIVQQGQSGMLVKLQEPNP
ncbi:MaoC family dehydratase N-terminal domain-containing protein [Ramlibacter sp. AW1]|uniref:MaoC family dehydratase N-terminal domain-containing protein n=1 Tax=Ramlibacter aurantiacus TaxID=2801330 RepID=A0A936ZGC4_9BURK|nr:MaoC/PaaZ C-terminal domain-containing protein [Ramlibacter aurantiacus]MBL0419372.1 MaoC family dehydratase N-terminal domain-containing protein [Ramlibacter aurantiacus]